MIYLATKNLGIIIELDFREGEEDISIFDAVTNTWILFEWNIRSTVWTDNRDKTFFVRLLNGQFNIFDNCPHKIGARIITFEKHNGFANTGLLNHVGILALFEHTTTASGVKASRFAARRGLGAGIITRQTRWCKVQNIGIITLGDTFEDLGIASRK